MDSEAKGLKGYRKYFIIQNGFDFFFMSFISIL